MEDKHLYRETQWDVSAEESHAHHGLVAIGFAVLAVLVIAFCIWTFGGSIPGEEIERVTFDEALKTLMVKLKDQGDVPTTMDIALTEWRLEPPSGVTVSDVEHVKITYQDGSTSEIAKADGLAE